MGFKIQRCKECGSYTLKEICPACGGTIIPAHPARFSPADPYGRYRRLAKKGKANKT